LVIPELRLLLAKADYGLDANGRKVAASRHRLAKAGLANLPRRRVIDDHLAAEDF
jgi:hypothetical protein